MRVKKNNPFLSDIRIAEIRAKGASFSAQREWAYHIAQQATQHPDLVDPELLAQARSYSTLGRRLEKQGFNPATELHRRGYKFSGWNRASIYSAAFGETTVPTKYLQNLPVTTETVGQVPSVKTVAEIGGLTSGPEFVTRWNRQALTQRLRTAVRQGPFEETAPWKEFYSQIGARARRFGIQGDIMPGLRPYAPELLQDALFPPTAGQKMGRLARTAWGAARAHPFIAGGAVAALGLYALQPGSWFSGRDDAANTIEGLAHRGEAGKNRRGNTDFGSGWRGLLRSKAFWAGTGVAAGIGAGVYLFRDSARDREEQAQKMSRMFAGYASALEQHGVYAGTGHKRILIPKSKLPEEDLEKLGFMGTMFAIPESGQDQLASYRHPFNLYHLHSHDDVWSMHKDRYPAVTMSMKRHFADNEGFGTNLLQAIGEIPAGMLHIATEGVPGAYYYAKNALTDSVPMRQRIQQDQAARISGKDDSYNTIEGLSHKGIAGKARRENTDFGSGWRGLLSALARPFTFAGRVERVYKGVIRQSLKSKGISTRGLKWDYVDTLKDKTLDLTVMASNKAGAPLAMMSRSLSPNEIYLTSIEVGTKGTGLGKEIYRREARALRKLGYRAGTKVVSPISNPVTARWQSVLYGSRSVRGMSAADVTRLQGAEIGVGEFQTRFAGEFEGRLGSSFGGFQHTGISSATRPNVGFGSPRLIAKITGFANKQIRQFRIARYQKGVRSRIGQESFARDALTKRQIDSVFGRGRESISAVELPFVEQTQIARQIGTKYDQALSDVKINLSSDLDIPDFQLPSRLKDIERETEMLRAKLRGNIDKQQMSALQKQASRQMSEAASNGGKRHRRFSGSGTSSV